MHIKWHEITIRIGMQFMMLNLFLGLFLRFCEFVRSTRPLWPDYFANIKDMSVFAGLGFCWDKRKEVANRVILLFIQNRRNENEREKKTLHLRISLNKMVVIKWISAHATAAQSSYFQTISFSNSSNLLHCCIEHFCGWFFI